MVAGDWTFSKSKPGMIRLLTVKTGVAEVGLDHDPQDRLNRGSVAVKSDVDRKGRSCPDGGNTASFARAQRDLGHDSFGASRPPTMFAQVPSPRSTIFIILVILGQDRLRFPLEPSIVHDLSVCT